MEQAPSAQKESVDVIFPDAKKRSKIVKHIWPDENIIGRSKTDLVLEEIARGVISSDHFDRTVLLEIKSPLDAEEDPNNPVKLFKEIEGDDRAKGVIAWRVLKDLQKRDNLEAKNIAEFLKKVSTPYKFERMEGEFLRKLGRVHNFQKVKEYALALIKLAKIIYGEKYKYWEQFESMKELADQTFPELAKIRQEKEKEKRDKKAEFINSPDGKIKIREIDDVVGMEEEIKAGKTPEEMEKETNELLLRKAREKFGE